MIGFRFKADQTEVKIIKKYLKYIKYKIAMPRQAKCQIKHFYPACYSCQCVNKCG